MYCLDEIKHGERAIEVYADGEAESPREWDNLGMMVCWHPRYDLGDERPKESPDEWLHYLALEHTNYEEVDQLSVRYSNLENLSKDQIWKILDQHYIFLPLYLYDHSGITMNTTGFTCPWDSGEVGYIYVSKEDIKKEYGVKRISKKLRERVVRYLKNEVETYDQFLTGDVYGYQVKNEAGEEIGSCWGFFGCDFEKNGLLDCAKSCI